MEGKSVSYINYVSIYGSEPSA